MSLRWKSPDRRYGDVCVSCGGRYPVDYEGPDCCPNADSPHPVIQENARIILGNEPMRQALFRAETAKFAAWLKSHPEQISVG